ncbi:hypothetical protein EDD30_4865 [Couchioplanes caeruleus]|uniref:Uncharacterized protein n=3 Tax=Couchioplanes caeruleus TaxID=56438 RepID=A0A1K0FA73_9ACTN|nr:hypothetical protein BG844_36345 [Couchioplanes caeruleus subsp. caeruleus]ROP31938.1 hypothetical protein EDD30_4865 [Couchioplanes caeruleus]
MTPVGVALIVGGIATLLVFRRVLFGSGGGNDTAVDHGAAASGKRARKAKRAVEGKRAVKGKRAVEGKRAVGESPESGRVEGERAQSGRVEGERARNGPIGAQRGGAVRRRRGLAAAEAGPAAEERPAPGPRSSRRFWPTSGTGDSTREPAPVPPPTVSTIGAATPGPVAEQDDLPPGMATTALRPAIAPREPSDGVVAPVVSAMPEPVHAFLDDLGEGVPSVATNDAVSSDEGTSGPDGKDGAGRYGRFGLHHFRPAEEVRPNPPAPAAAGPTDVRLVSLGEPIPDEEPRLEAADEDDEWSGAGADQGDQWPSAVVDEDRGWLAAPMISDQDVPLGRERDTPVGREEAGLEDPDLSGEFEAVHDTDASGSFPAAMDPFAGGAFDVDPFDHEAGAAPVGSDLSLFDREAGAAPVGSDLSLFDREAEEEPGGSAVEPLSGARQWSGPAARRFGDRVEGWVRPQYRDEPVSGDYWTPVPDAGYGWPVPVERIPQVPPAPGGDPDPEVESEPTALVPQWPPTRPDDRIGVPRPWRGGGHDAADGRDRRSDRDQQAEQDQQFQRFGFNPSRRGDDPGRRGDDPSCRGDDPSCRGGDPSCRPDVGHPGRTGGGGYAGRPASAEGPIWTVPDLPDAVLPELTWARTTADEDESGRLRRASIKVRRQRGAAGEPTQNLPAVDAGGYDRAPQQPARARPRPRPRPGAGQSEARSTVYVSRHAAEPS